MFLFLLQACNIHTAIFKKPALSADGAFLTLIPERERREQQRFFWLRFLLVPLPQLYVD